MDLIISCFIRYTPLGRAGFRACPSFFSVWQPSPTPSLVPSSAPLPENQAGMSECVGEMSELCRKVVRLPREQKLGESLRPPLVLLRRTLVGNRVGLSAHPRTRPKTLGAVLSKILLEGEELSGTFPPTLAHGRTLVGQALSKRKNLVASNKTSVCPSNLFQLCRIRIRLRGRVEPASRLGEQHLCLCPLAQLFSVCRDSASKKSPSRLRTEARLVIPNLFGMKPRAFGLFFMPARMPSADENVQKVLNRIDSVTLYLPQKADRTASVVA